MMKRHKNKRFFFRRNGSQQNEGKSSFTHLSLQQSVVLCHTALCLKHGNTIRRKGLCEEKPQRGISSFSREIVHGQKKCLETAGRLKKQNSGSTSKQELIVPTFHRATAECNGKQGNFKAFSFFTVWQQWCGFIVYQSFFIISLFFFP